jgi:hypothetical protein
MLNLTTAGSAGNIGGALFEQGDPQGAGAGALNSFVRLESRYCSHTEQGYNTDARPVQFNTLPGHNTHALKLGDVREVEVDGQLYREFLLNVNENRCNPLISLDQLRLFVGDSGNLNHYNTATHKLNGLSAVYDMDAGGDHWVKLNDRLVHGHGKVDMTLLVPESVFAGASDSTFVYLYSKFGEHYGADGGFEEWATRKGPQPPPPPPTGSISGTIFQDANMDGVFQSTEFVGNGTVFIDANGDGMLDNGEVSATNNAQGQYTLSGLVVGQTYTLGFVPDTGFDATTALPVTVTVTAANPNVTGVNFGEVTSSGPPSF